MPIQHQIEQDYLTAFKGRDRQRVGALRLIKSALKNEEIHLRVQTLNDEQTIAVLTREARRRRESIAMYQQGNRPELAAAEQLELQIMSAYLPAQLDDQQLDVIVQAAIAELQATSKDFGKVMNAVMAKVKGQADGNRVSAAVKRLLK